MIGKDIWEWFYARQKETQWSNPRKPFKEKFIEPLKCPKCGAWHFDLWWTSGQKYYKCGICGFKA